MAGERQVRVAIITVSDSCYAGRREDENRAVIEEMVGRLGWRVVHYEVVPDDFEAIKAALLRCADELKVDVVFTNGGTGFSPTDVTPEATREVIEKEVPGIPEAMRFEGYKRTRRAILSRGIAGIRGRTLIVNLPGTTRGVRESLEAILEPLPHGLEDLRGERPEH